MDLSKAESTSEFSSLEAITDNLPKTCKARLRTLTKLAEMLNIDDLSFVNYATAIHDLSSWKLSERRTLLQLQRAEKELRDHLTLVQHEEKLITKWIEEMGNGSIATQTSELENRRDASIRKAKEYRNALEKLVQNAVEEPSASVRDVIDQKERNVAQEKKVKTKRAKLQTFQGLPPNLNIARQELQATQEEYNRLLQIRERLLGRMADGLQ